MISNFFNFIKDIFSERKFLFRLSINDFKAKYSGSFLGIMWAFIQPLINILVMWFVFEMGFKNAPIGNVPFMLWFVPAYVPWLFFTDIMNSSATCLYEYNYLVKKVKFRVSILPIMKIISAFFVHIFFIAFILIIFALYKFKLSLYSIQAIYYTFSLIAFCIGLSWFISALSVFFKDISQIVSMILQIGFWITPIFWNPEQMHLNFDFILKINPIYYIVRGYRESFVFNIGFWERPFSTLYFWIVTFIFFILGALIFKKLRPLFADEL